MTSAETPLAAKLKDRIRRAGPIGVDDYMQACLHDPEHGYYRHRPAIGAAGDFVTAPEISQVFGELIGLWCAVAWREMGAPANLNLVELGPGRGTLMRDALRAARIVPGFRAALAVHLVESNATLRSAQAATLADCGVPLEFHDDVVEALNGRTRVGDGATLVVANEFLDTLPIVQIAYRDGRWRDRVVIVDEASDDLAFDVDRNDEGWEHGRTHGLVPPDLIPQEGDIFELSKHSTTLATMLGARQSHGPICALLVDYGHAKSGFGDTLQGVAGQQHVSPFHAPGDTDLSAQVDFQRLAEACRRAGLAVETTLPQAELLGRLGIVERASRLMAANPARAAEIEAGVARLIQPSGMGSRFLALGVRSEGVAPLPGFDR
ncbi:SAM-dependent methyltransferase [Hyphomicrobium sp.]|uniref:class I SAM-dependent methyltransferase n=1 Tax=Hyphomicrobium sp. TaxID=82 RepID=UPI0025BD8AAD|nr:SAM-dependent methyltransferase [Hyphomicrobium sp.]MCC7251170.1 SAM-dependent methyltransferase [Hyphomicrobium sp.]